MMILKRRYLQITFFTIIVLGSLIASPNVLGEDEPITKDYQLPGQSWMFIEEINFTENVLIDYDWHCDLEVQGVGVTKEDFLIMLGLGLTERSVYFEQLPYFKGKADYGKLTTDNNGTIYFIFYNPETQQGDLTFTYTYRTNILKPWVIGLITTIVTVIVLSIAFYYVIKLRNKMIHDAIEAAEDEEKLSPERRYLG